MIEISKRSQFFNTIKKLRKSQIKYRTPMILKMYGSLNKLDLENENRYILCNFLDQNSDILQFKEDIYFTNNEKSINQLFLTAFNKARQHEMVNTLFEDYIDSINAISQKLEFSQDL